MLYIREYHVDAYIIINYYNIALNWYTADIHILLQINVHNSMRYYIMKILI